MVTYKILLDERRVKSDNTYSVIVRITFNRKVSTLNTGVNMHKEFWDFKNSNVKPTHPNAQLLNKKVTEFYLKVQKAVLKLESEETFSLEELKLWINNDGKPIIVKEVINFKDYADMLIADMLAINKAGNAIIYQTATNKLMAFTNSPKLKFIDITFGILDKFKTDLIKSGLKPNSISNYFRTLRAIYNKAIKEKIVDRSHYPFLDVTFKTERTAKRSITTEELIKIMRLDLKLISQEWKARSYFLISFALRGASFTDMAYLKPENIRRGYLTYKRRKTGKELKIKLLPFTMELFDHYKDTNLRYLLPILPDDIIEDSLQAKKVIFQWIKTSNNYLGRLAKTCEIEEELTSYVTRHTFATVAKKKLGYSNEVIAECLGHEYGNKITNIYLDNFDQSLIDEVNERVISLINC